jgi:hypothetical protein
VKKDKKIPLWIKTGVVGAIYGIFGSIFLLFGMLGMSSTLMYYFFVPVLYSDYLIVKLFSFFSFEIANGTVAWIFFIFYNLILFFLIGSLIGYVIGRLKKYEK